MLKFQLIVLIQNAVYNYMLFLFLNSYYYEDKKTDKKTLIMASFRAAASAVRAFSTSSRQAQLVKAPIQVREFVDTE